MVIVSLALTVPFHSNPDALVITHAPLVAAQELFSAIKSGDSCPISSDPALSPCGPIPVLVNFTSMATMFPAPVQAAASVILTERSSNLAPRPQTLSGDDVFLGAGAAATKLVALSFVSAQPPPILTAALSLAGAGVGP